MEKIRRMGAISYLVTITMISLIAYDGCGGGHSDAVNSRQDGEDVSLPSVTKMTVSEPLNIVVPSDWTTFDIQFDQNTSTVSFNQGEVEVKIDQPVEKSRVHYNRGFVELPIPSRFGAGNMVVYHAEDNHYPYGYHYNVDLYDCWTDCEYDMLVAKPDRAVADLHVFVKDKCLRIEGFYRENLSPKGARKDLDHKTTCAPEFDFETVMDAAIEYVQELLKDKAGIILTVILVVALIAVIVYVCYLYWPAIAAALVAAGAIVLGYAGQVGAGGDDDGDDANDPPADGDDGNDVGEPPNDGDDGDDQGGPPPLPDPIPDPRDTTPPTVVTDACRIETLGNGRYRIEVKFADLGDNASGFNSAYLQLQDPSYQFHGIGGRNDSNPVVLEVSMIGRNAGIWKVFAWAKDNAGNDSTLLDTGLRITWGAPWIEDQSMEGPSSTGQSVYRAKFDSLAIYINIEVKILI